jgi:hypothetical protein
MQVDEARQHVLPGDIMDLSIGRGRVTGADRGDAWAVDDEPTGIQHAPERGNPRIRQYDHAF